MDESIVAINLEKLPSSPDLHVWSDYIELLCFINKDGFISKADVIDRLQEGMDIDLSVEDQEDLESEKSNDIRMNKIELKASDWFGHLEYRKGIFGKLDFYPFEVSVDGDSLTRKNELSIKPDSLTYLSLWQSWPDRCEHKVGQAQFEARQTVERDRQAALEKA